MVVFSMLLHLLAWVRSDGVAFTYKESECSPKPYKLGLAGRLVRSLRYWFSKTMGAADVSKRTSPLERLTTEKLKGSSWYLN